MRDRLKEPQFLSQSYGHRTPTRNDSVASANLLVAPTGAKPRPPPGAGGRAWVEGAAPQMPLRGVLTAGPPKCHSDVATSDCRERF